LLLNLKKEFFMLPKDLTSDVTKQLKGIHGQIGGLIKMLEKDQDPEQILHQFKAIQKSLDKAHAELLDEVFRKALAVRIVEANEACPGNCGYEGQIQTVRKQFPTFNSRELAGKIKEINPIAEWLKNHNRDFEQ